MDLTSVRKRSERRRRGAILVSVLWILIFVAFLAVVLRTQMTGVLASVRVTEDKASARILAEAGLAQAAAEIRAGPPDGEGRLDDEMSSTITLPAGTASIFITNEATRIDLNTADRDLIVGALQAAGATRPVADDLATRIVGRRTQSPPALFQTVADFAAFPGVSPDIAIAIEPYVTVSSGLAGVRVEALDVELLGAIPGLSPSVPRAITDYRAGRLSREQFEQSLGGVAFNTWELAPTWRVDLKATLQSGYSESFEALMLVSAADGLPYRVLDWRRAAVELE